MVRLITDEELSIFMTTRVVTAHTVEKDHERYNGYICTRVISSGEEDAILAVSCKSRWRALEHLADIVAMINSAQLSSNELIDRIKAGKIKL